MTIKSDVSGNGAHLSRVIAKKMCFFCDKIIKTKWMSGSKTMGRFEVDFRWEWRGVHRVQCVIKTRTDNSGRMPPFVPKSFSNLSNVAKCPNVYEYICREASQKKQMWILWLVMRRMAAGTGLQSHFSNYSGLRTLNTNLSHDDVDSNKIRQWPLLLTWFDFSPSMDK